MIILNLKSLISRFLRYSQTILLNGVSFVVQTNGLKKWSPNAVGDVGTRDVGGAEEMITLECKIVHSSKAIFFF